MKSYGVTIQMKPLQWYFYMVLFILYVVLTFESVNEMLWYYHSNETSSVLSHGTVYSGAPARAKRAWDRAPYSWNMVNLFSFGCHVIDRAYVRTYVRVYRLYGWGRGDYQKEGRGVSGVSWQVHIFNIGF